MASKSKHKRTKMLRRIKHRQEKKALKARIAKIREEKAA